MTSVYQIALQIQQDYSNPDYSSLDSRTRYIAFFYIVFLPLSIIVKVLKSLVLDYKYMVMSHDHLKTWIWIHLLAKEAWVFLLVLM